MLREKKSISRAFALLSAVMIMITGCASTGSQSKSEPPMLTITAGEAEIQAIRTTYSWQNKGTGVEADGPHPLDMAEDLPIIEVSENETVSLTFETAPDQVTVLAWKSYAAGSAYDEPELSLQVFENLTVTLPFDDRYLYEVHATWKIQDEVGGDAYYGFASAPME